MPAEQDSTRTTSPEQPPLTSGAVAKRFAVDVATVKRWADQGLIPYFTTPSGHRRFHVEDVERLRSTRLSA